MHDLALRLGQHLQLSAAALAIALAAGLPLGVLAARGGRARGLTLAGVGIVRVLPSLAVLALAEPYLGVGFAPALVALAFLAVPPVAINVAAGLRGVPAAAIEAARGLGMSPRQIRRRVEWPLALPLVFAGVRVAAVEVIASATLAAFIGGGGLGDFIVNGLAGGDTGELYEGALAVAALALLVQGLLSVAERRLTRRRA